MRQHPSKTGGVHVLAALGITLLLGNWSRPALAVDGVIEINDARAKAGLITPGDAAGYPITLSTGGSYRLTGNLAVPNNTDGIEIATVDPVTIDLNGFRIAGSNVCVEACPSLACAPNTFPSVVDPGTGIRAKAGSKNVSIYNGSIVGMTNRGIDLRLSRIITIDRIQFRDNAGDALAVGTDGVITNCVANRNGGSGFFVGPTNVVKDNASACNRLDGFHIEGKSLLFGNTSVSNGSNLVLIDDTHTGYNYNVLSGNCTDNGVGGAKGRSLGQNTCNGGAPF